jgi:uracil-DNA glycosylase family 4
MDLPSLDREILVCRKCARLVAWREAVARKKRAAYADWEYWGKPVPGFGDPKARILAVGLAPGAHGSNRTGRQFTGDASGRFLFPALHRAGLASRSDSWSRDDDLRLTGLYLTAACRCVPPANKPTAEEFANCRPFLGREIALIRPRVIVCLGRSAVEGVLRLHSLQISKFRFQHGATWEIQPRESERSRWLLSSYHPSQQNTQTRKLTAPMFDGIWRRARELAGID